MHREVARSRMIPWPTAAGTAIVFAALLSRVFSRFQTIALGALIGLGVLMVIDCLASMWLLGRRPVSVQVTKTTVVAPERFQLTLSAPPGWSDLRIVLRLSLIHI